MSRAKTLRGASYLSRVLAGLTTNPRLDLRALRSIKVTLAAKNDHFGARHFVKEQLPRMRYANPDLNIEVAKVPKSATDVWQPEMVLTFASGEVRTLDLHGKWSTTIVKEVMDVAGGSSWLRWKTEATASGYPLIPGEDKEGQKTTTKVQRSSPWKKPSFRREAPTSEPSMAQSNNTSASAVLP